MRVTILNYPYAPDLARPEDLLERYASLTGWASALRYGGASVTVIQRFHRDAGLEREGTVFRFVADPYSARLRGWQIPHAAHRATALSTPDLVHVNGLAFPVQLAALRLVLPRACPVAAQHHAEAAPEGVRGLVHRLGLRAADGLLFAAQPLAHPWREARLLPLRRPVYEVMEGSTRFAPRAMETARASTAMAGSPALVFVGHLDDNKDPLTVLAGFEAVLEELPEARLYLVFRGRQLETEVVRRIAASASLQRTVTLVGEVPHHRMPDVFSSAHVLVLGSHREGSGYALAEAMACGVVPVVTDIPSFRAMTDGGRIGSLWKPGDARALATAIRAVVARPHDEHSRAARAFFEHHLSWPAIARDALAAYRDLAARRAARSIRN